MLHLKYVSSLYVYNQLEEYIKSENNDHYENDIILIISPFSRFLFHLV